MSDLCVLFGRPRRTTHADDRFELEVLAAEELGLESYSVPLDPIVLGDIDRALRHLPRPQGRTWLYRGWMLREEEYTALHEALVERDEELVVDPESVAEASCAPNYLPLLAHGPSSMDRDRQHRGGVGSGAGARPSALGGEGLRKGREGGMAASMLRPGPRRLRCLCGDL